MELGRLRYVVVVVVVVGGSHDFPNLSVCRLFIRLFSVGGRIERRKRRWVHYWEYGEGRGQVEKIWDHGHVCGERGMIGEEEGEEKGLDESGSEGFDHICRHLGGFIFFFFIFLFSPFIPSPHSPKPVPRAPPQGDWRW